MIDKHGEVYPDEPEDTAQYAGKGWAVAVQIMDRIKQYQPVVSRVDRTTGKTTLIFIGRSQAGPMLEVYEREVRRMSHRAAFLVHQWAAPRFPIITERTVQEYAEVFPDQHPLIVIPEDYPAYRRVRGIE